MTTTWPAKVTPLGGLICHLDTDLGELLNVAKAITPRIGKCNVRRAGIDQCAQQERFARVCEIRQFELGDNASHIGVLIFQSHPE